MSRDQYSYWRSLLKRLPGAIPQEPQCGFWRRRMGRGGAWRPVAIWVDANSAMKCLDGDRPVEPWTVWDQVCANATTEADYRARVAGTPYRDEFHVAGTSETTTDVARAAPIGPTPRRPHGNQATHDKDSKA